MSLVTHNQTAPRSLWHFDVTRVTRVSQAEIENTDLIEHSAFVTTPAGRTRRPGIKINLNHKCRVSYQIEIIADPKPSINLFYDCENRMRSMQIPVSGWTWLILIFFDKFGLLAQ